MRKGLLTGTALVLLSCAVTARAQQGGSYYGYPQARVAGNYGYPGWGYPANSNYQAVGYPMVGQALYPQPGDSATPAQILSFLGATVPPAGADADGDQFVVQANTPTKPAPTDPLAAVTPVACHAIDSAPATPAAACSTPAAVCGIPSGVYGCSPAMYLAPGYDTVDPVVEAPSCAVFPKTPHRDIFWATAEYMAVSTRPGPVPPLVTTGAPSDAHPGALGQPGTAVIFGGSPVDFGILSGMRGEIGIYLDCESHFGVELGGFDLVKSTVHFAASSDGNGSPLIARPIFDSATGLQGALLSSSPAVNLAAVEMGAPLQTLVGSTTVDATQSLWGSELNFSLQANRDDCVRWQFLSGIRYMQLDEDITINDTRSQPAGEVGPVLTYLGFPLNPGDVESDHDDFHTSNKFVGMQLGGTVEFLLGPFFLDTWAKAGIGANFQSVQINGSTSVVSTAIGNQTTQGGILAQPSNIGTHDRTVFSAVPEVGVTVGVDLTRWFRLQAGYSFLLWTDVVRPGDQMDLGVSSFQVPSSQTYVGTAGMPGSGRPAFTYNESLFYMHTFTLGAIVHF